MSPTKCASHHFGPWMIEPEWFKSSVAAIRAGILRPDGQSTAVAETQQAVADGDSIGIYTEEGYPIYEAKIIDGTAVLPVEGSMMKIRSKFGGTSTVDVRNVLRRAVADDRVSSILLHIDSPGGTVAGTDALARDVGEANKVKPVHAHIEDMGASAAYYMASQARRITASPTSLVGSLGVRLTVIDSQKYYADDGIIFHEINTGEFKSAGAEGTEVTDKQLAYFQGIVNDAVSHFKAAVSGGRGARLTKPVDELFDGRMHDAQTAQLLGLIDEVSTLDTAMQAIRMETETMTAQEYRAHTAANPEAEEVKEVFTKGHSAGVADSRKELANLQTVAPGRAQLVLDAFILGQNAESLKLTVAALAKSEADHKAKIEEANKEIERLKFVAEGQAAVGTKPKTDGAKADDKFSGLEGDALIEAEWDADKDGCKANFRVFNAYLGYRKSQMERPEMPKKE